MKISTRITKIYEEKYKTLLIIPFLLLMLALVQISVQYVQTGDVVNRGISLKGGSTITIEYSTPFDIPALKAHLSSSLPQGHVALRTLRSAGTIVSVAVDSDAQEEAEIDALLKAIRQNVPLPPQSYSVEIVGSSLGKSFFLQMITSLLIAFILMGVVVFIYFRSAAPSAAVILAAFSDIVVTLAVFNLTGIKLSSAGIAAFLMLIGYSVDTDILLSTRVLKRQHGTIMERIYSAMKTGLTMVGTTLAVLAMGIILVQSDVIKQIMIILFIGLLTDLVMTWIQNVGILRLYLERKRT